MRKIALSVIPLIVIVVVAKFAPAHDVGADPAYQAGGPSQIVVAQTAPKSHASSQPPRPEAVEHSPGVPLWLEDPSVMDGSWRRWPSVTDF